MVSERRIWVSTTEHGKRVRSWRKTEQRPGEKGWEKEGRKRNKPGFWTGGNALELSKTLKQTKRNRISEATRGREAEE